jgi:hypothetical protein
MHILVEDLKGRDSLEELGIDGKIILQFILDDEDVVVD